MAERDPTGPGAEGSSRAAHLARLARLELDEAALRAREADLDAILRFVGQLGELDLEGVQPLTHPLDHPMTPAADTPGGHLPTAALLRMAPDAEGPFIRVPRVLEGGGSS